MSASEQPPKPPTPKRRWYQYSLRSLMIFGTLCAFACSWFAVKRQQAETQRQAVEALAFSDDRLCLVKYDYEVDDKGHWIRCESPPAPDWLLKLLGRDFFATVVEVSNSEMSAEGNGFRGNNIREQIGKLTRLRKLRLYRSNATDADLLHLHDLAQLRELSLFNAQITDAGLRQLTAFPQLQVLAVGSRENDITDRGLETLKRLTHLRELRLTCRRVSDAGMRRIGRLGHLETLEICTDGIIDAGLESLRPLRNLKSLRAGIVTDTGLRTISELAGLEELALDVTKVSDSGLERLSALPRLRNLDFWGRSAIRVGSLRSLPRLEELSISSATDANLDGLAELRGLRHLVIKGDFTDAGMRNLESLKRLHTVMLGSPAVTGAAMKHLKPLTELERITLRCRSLTLNDWAELHATFPKCKIWAY
ncbi:MAG: hypothetical protein ABFC96_11405 [Thermoguttaceae bacterium]